MEEAVCVICKAVATWMKFGKALCDYHWEIANDHKRDRD